MDRTIIEQLRIWSVELADLADDAERNLSKNASASAEVVETEAPGCRLIAASFMLRFRDKHGSGAGLPSNSGALRVRDIRASEVTIERAKAGSGRQQISACHDDIT